MKPYKRNGKKILVRNTKKANCASKKAFMIGEKKVSTLVNSLIKKLKKYKKIKKSIKKDVHKHAFWKYF